MSVASHELKAPPPRLQLPLQAVERRLPGLVQDPEGAAWLRGKLLLLRRHGQRLGRLLNESNALKGRRRKRMPITVRHHSFDVRIDVSA